MLLARSERAKRGELGSVYPLSLPHKLTNTLLPKPKAEELARKEVCRLVLLSMSSDHF